MTALRWTAARWTAMAVTALLIGGCADNPIQAPPAAAQATYGAAWCDTYVNGAQNSNCIAASVADDKACRPGGGDANFASYHACRISEMQQRLAAPWDIRVAAPCRLPDGTVVRDSTQSCRLQAEAFFKE